jgi:hypothetical protein
MNPSEETTEMIIMSVPLGDYCFAYVNEDITIQVSTRGTEPLDLVDAFVSYMKAVGFAPEAIESALDIKAIVMKSFRVPGSILEPKE